MPYWVRSFPGQAEHVSEVRHFTTHAVGDRPGVDDVVLIASELAGNAITHTNSGNPEGYFTVHLAEFEDRWLIAVSDAGGPSEPRIRPTDAEEHEAGRGLALVAALSSQWGTAGDGNARVVWAEIPIPGTLASEPVLAGRERQTA